jgi:hypothetical protein
VGLFFAQRVWTPDTRFPSFLGPLAACLMSWPIDPPVCGFPSFLVCPLVTSRLSHFPRLPPHRTPNVQPRYLHSTSGYDTLCPTPLHRPAPAAPAIRGPRISWCGIPRSPIRHTEFGIRNLEIRNPRSPKHGAVEVIYSIPTFSRLTPKHGAVGYPPT